MKTVGIKNASKPSKKGILVATDYGGNDLIEISLFFDKSLVSLGVLEDSSPGIISVCLDNNISLHS